MMNLQTGFDQIWETLTRRLQSSQAIRNWTVIKGYVGEDFTAQSGDLRIDCILANQTQITVSRDDFERVYRIWPQYLSGDFQRNKIRDITRHSKYIISILHQVLEGEEQVEVKPNASEQDTPSNNQVVGNVGLYFVCYRLSRLGWNVLPTSRNARGVDIIAYNQDASRTITIQVKALSRRSPVPLGSTLAYLIADYVVICRHVLTYSPESFVLTPLEVNDLVHRGEKNGKISFWLQPRAYEQEHFRENWQRLI
jgi:hypothetical protein